MHGMRDRMKELGFGQGDDGYADGGQAISRLFTVDC